MGLMKHVGAKEKAQLEFGSIKHKNMYSKIREREPRKRLNEPNTSDM